MPGPVALPGLNDANPVRQNTAIRQISERLDDYAPIDSPVLTGDPQAPTPDLADNDTSIATTAYVQGQNYTTKTYVDGANATQDTAIAGKAAAVHTHAESDITNLVTDLAGKEPAIAAGTTDQYWRGDKSWQAFPTQRLVAAYSTRLSASTTVTTLFPTGASAPASTAGTQVLSLSVTTTSATQVVDFFYSSFFSVASVSVVSVAAGVFVGGVCTAAIVQGNVASGSGNAQHVISNRYAPGAAGTYTFTVRVGPVAATSVFVDSLYGAAGNTSLTAYVIEP